MQPLGLLFQNRRAEDAAGVANHESHLLGRGLARRHDEIAFVLAIVIVHHHDHLSRSDGFEGGLYGVERRAHDVVWS
jgi:hypothetical protein